MARMHNSSLPLRLLLLGLVAMWNATQAATRSVPREKRFANVEIAGIYLFDRYKVELRKSRVTLGNLSWSST